MEIMGIPKMKILETLNESYEWTAEEFKVIFHIINYTNKDDEFWWSYRKLAEWIGLERRTVSRTFKKLEGKGFIQDTGTRKGRFNDVKVWFVDFDKWSVGATTSRHSERQLMGTGSATQLEPGVPASRNSECQLVGTGSATNPPKRTPLNESPSSKSIDLDEMKPIWNEERGDWEIINPDPVIDLDEIFGTTPPERGTIQ